MGVSTKTTVAVAGTAKEPEGTVKTYKTVYKNFIGKAWGNVINKPTSKHIGKTFYNIKIDKGVKITVEKGNDIVIYEGGVDNDLSFVLFPNEKRQANKAGKPVKDGDMRLSIIQTVLE